MNRLELLNAALIGEELALAWNDGRESYIKLDHLRKCCPCAACQGEPDVTGKVARPRVRHNENSYVLRRYEHVGSYALQCFWADGHNTGIYGYEYLRKLG